MNAAFSVLHGDRLLDATEKLGKGLKVRTGGARYLTYLHDVQGRTEKVLRGGAGLNFFKLRVGHHYLHTNLVIVLFMLK